jgi:NADH:ubiquinone oxidoreductase subunit 5 (subunit L)/multisubunit Na+/H+ antiporter MnhA subunit
LTFLVKTAAHRTIVEGAHDAPFVMAFPLFVLSFGAIFLGYVTKDLAIGLGTVFWQQSLYTHPSHSLFVEAEFIPQYIKLFPVCCALISSGVAFYLYSFCSKFLSSFKTSFIGLKFYTFLNRKWFFDKVYTEYCVQPMLHFGWR